MDSLKTCCKCKEERPRTEFNKNKSKPDGLNNYCKPCMKSYKRAWQSQEDVKERHKLQQREKRKNPEYAEAQRQVCRNYHAKNKEQIRSRQKQYYLDNIEYMHERASIGRGERAKRVPPWLTDEQRWVIREFYDLRNLRSEATGVEHHVDHIVPLQGKTVSGLHVPWNLQVIPASENLSKSNSFAA